MAGSFAARVASRHGVAPVDVLIAVKPLYARRSRTNADQHVKGAPRGDVMGHSDQAFLKAHRAVQPRHHSRREHPSVECDQ
jgi:hypothetical protein